MRNPLIFVSAFLLWTFTVQESFAKVEGFWMWQPDPNGVRYVLPRLEGESPSEFAARYQKSLKNSKTYKKLQNTEFINLATEPSTFSELPPSTPEKPRVAVVMNRPHQMTDKGTYFKKVVTSFEKEGPNLFAIPVGLETALSPQDMTEFREKLNSFDGQLGVGGDDVHPKAYGQKSIKRTIGNINFKRDLEQSAYFKEYLANGKGRVFYICGSMQRAAVMDGHAFVTDIKDITKQAHYIDNGLAMIEVMAEPNSELAAAAGATRFKTSNAHHSAVDPTKNLSGAVPTSKITAFNIEPDGTRGHVVKAIEYPNNAGFATQFHPEFRGSPEEDRIVQYVATGWKMRGRYAPKDIVSCMQRRLENLLATVP